MPKTTAPERLESEIAPAIKVPEMPRQPVTVARSELDPHLKSPLGLYLKQNRLSEVSMARALGLARLAVQKLTRGESLPSLPVAFEIERITKGVVPIEAWLGMPRALEAVRGLRAKQPEGIKEALAPHAPVVGAVSADKESAQWQPHNQDELEEDDEPAEGH